MLKIKINTKDRRFSVPVPYTVLNIFCRLITSKRILRYANNAIEKEGKSTFKIPQLDSQDLKPLIRALSENKGLKLVETKLKDGTEVNITL